MARHAASVIQGALAVVLFQMRSAAIMEFIAALKVIFVTMVVGVAERAEASFKRKKQDQSIFEGFYWIIWVGWSKRSLLFWTSF